MSNRHSGSCLCGQARYEMDGTFERFFLCHCAYCRKDTGSAHAANLFARDAELRWLAGEDNVRFFNLPGTRHSRSFCATCGSALPWRMGRSLVVPAGSLDSEVPLRPEAHIFVASRAGWDDRLEAVAMVERFPV